MNASNKSSKICKFSKLFINIFDSKIKRLSNYKKYKSLNHTILSINDTVA